MQGTITTVQRMSVHDGPGIRSTIFLKGCNLRCSWCHNPETFSKSPELEWIKSKCINCKSCLEVCPTNALSVDKNDQVTFTKQECTACFECVEHCYPKALNIIGRTVTVKELFAEIEQDIPFFKESGGGVTLSGGEPMMQFRFSLEVLKYLKSKGIHTAIETNMTAEWGLYSEILPYIDLVMADLKTINKETSKKWTGGNLQRIINNVKKLDSSGTHYILRTPLIPNVNDGVQEKSRIDEFILKLKNIDKHQYLPYHELGLTKYENLGIKPNFSC